ncbi:hypothetical protein [Caenimonas aquaedulcis]|uniref:Uncharacterized protein n=1 Tax=Caenimonas aquaedulcis TaxID=2793270 RepID=A0A931MF81_9BURK|nr:hypothetical protein [Caenimonas aquaedulcis]MBG9386884.1 hypothetical protein [Caenimonas aquaedulcis]
MNFQRFARTASFAGLAAASAVLAGCYVVPLQTPPPASVQLAPAAPLTFSARLYPSNDMAAAYGTVMAVVTNDLNGRGHFTTNINGESFSGEATRVAGSREGVANGLGNRGGFLNCRYAMNSATMGTGTCQHSNGAQFTMHVGG